MMRPHHRTSAFTLLELLVVIAIAAAIASTIAVGLARSGPERSVRRALEGVAIELTMARVEAMHRGEPATIEVWVTPDEVRLLRGDREKAWRADRVSIVPVRGVTTSLMREETVLGPHGGVMVAFDTMGRTRERRWEVWSEAARDRIWAIEFEPVSGAPRVVKPGTPAKP